MLRFAPTPLGDMQINDLRIALLNYIISKQSNEPLLVRFDDLKKSKNVEGSEKQILEILQLFSIEHMPAVYQSENIKKYLQMAMQLLINQKAFSCFCSDEKLQQMTDVYTGGCDLLEDHQVIDNEQPFTVRIKAPKEIGSFVILTREKLPLPLFASALDDMLYDTSTVIRSEKNKANTAKEIHIRKSIGYDKEIEYIHIPDIKDDNNNPTVQHLIEEGYLPIAITNYLLSMGNTTPKEIFTLEEAFKWFDINKLSKEQTKFDIEQLNTINKEHIKLLDDMRLSKILGYADNDFGALAKVYLEECNTIKQIKEKIDAILQPKSEPSEFCEEYKLIKQTILEAPFFNEYSEFEKYISEKTALNDKSLFKPLRYILTGRQNGPKLEDIYKYIKNYLGEIVQ